METWTLCFPQQNSKCDFPDKPKILRGSEQKIYMFFSSGLTFIKLQWTLKTCQPLRSEQTETFRQYRTNYDPIKNNGMRKKQKFCERQEH